MIIEEYISLADKNWFRTGGSARYFAQPTNAAEFKEALLFAKKYNLDVTVLGLGANVLISDDGIDGIVIKPAIRDITLVDEGNNKGCVKVGAGVTIHQLIEWCLEHNLIGLEEFSAIPGTVGGSVYNNLHYFEHSLSDFIISGEIIWKDTCKTEIVDKEWFGFGYDESRLHNDDSYLLYATFCLKKVNDFEVSFARGRRSEITRHRVKRYPMAFTCGCFFKNFDKDEVNLQVNGKKAVWVAYYLDKLGYKGALRAGDALVSPQHANMIIHTGKATSSDIIKLARKMQEGVKKEFGIIPQPECRLLGFKDYPLLK